MTTLQEIEAQGKPLIQQYEALEADQTKINQSIGGLRAQLLENQTVNEELDLLEEDAEVFKAIGPVLVKMEVTDAKANVKQRLDRITGEINRLDKNFKDKEEEKGKIRSQITILQAKAQEIQKAASGQAGDE